jgi:hypothetical protein
MPEAADFLAASVTEAPGLTARRRVIRASAAGIGLAAALTALIAWQVWPGFMSYDSIFALSQARTGIVSAEYPPALSYVWFLADHLYPGPGLMLIWQVFGILAAMAVLGARARLPVGFVLLGVALVAVSPAALGPMTVIWKDDWMSLFIALALCAMTARRRGASLLWPVCLCLATSFRLNSLPAIVPLVWLGATCGTPPARLEFARQSGRFALIVFTIVTVAGASLVWRLPDFRRLPDPFHPELTQVHDLLGISVCEGIDLLPPAFTPNGTTVEQLREIYHPQHVQWSFNIGARAGPHRLDPEAFRRMDLDDLTAAWKQALRDHPACYLWHRAQVARYLLGLNPGPVFYKFNPLIDDNDLGIADRGAGYSALAAWLDEATPWRALNVASDLLSRVWLFMAAAAIALCSGASLKTGRPFTAACVFASVVLYSACNFVLDPAADLRYQHWPVIGSIFTIMFALCPPPRGVARSGRP